LYFIDLSFSAIKNQKNDKNVFKMHKKRNREINGKYIEVTGISEETLIKMMPKFKKVVNA